jgi:putative component of toxin-antitoxin plasmid stabilization module
MSNPSKPDEINKIKAEYNKKLKDLEAKLASKHKELNQIERAIMHDTKKVDHSGISNLKLKKAEVNRAISLLKKEIKGINKEKTKKLKKL